MNTSVEDCKAIQDSVILVLPINLSNEDVKECQDKELLEYSATESEGPMSTVRGLPYESEEFIPLILLVPN